jgi:transcriptional regulator with XRE-family HTH domain
LAAVLGRAHQLGHTLAKAAQCLGISANHLSLLRSGTRKIQKIETELVTRMAAYLGVPALQVKMMAGQIRPEDGELPSVELEIEKAVTFILSDAIWGPLAPRELKSSSLDMKRLIVMLYEAASGHKLIPDCRIEAHLAQVQIMARSCRETAPRTWGRDS